MKSRKKFSFSVIPAAVLTLALTACAAVGTQAVSGGTQGVSVAGESVDANDTAFRPDGEAARIYENGGMKLLVPMEYDALVIVESGRENELFSVSEKASVEAVKAMGDDYDGAGWLFSVGAVTEDELHEALCYDMSGADVFARDGNGQYYMYYHPTDVRIVRENDEYADDDIAQWTALNEWAASAPDTFIADNPGLTPEKRGNTELDIFLYRLAYMDNVNYTISEASYGPMDGRGLDAKPYLDRLMNGVTFEPVDDPDETPDGEYVVLYFPDDDTRFDFFLMEGGENYIRQVWSDNFEQLYKASYADGVTKASDILSEWYDYALVGEAGEALDASGFTGEEFVGEWQDSVSQRAVMSVKATDETGVYDILVHWGGSYNSAMQWRMKAVAGAQDEILSYENGVKAELFFPDDGSEEQETVIWENGAGYLMFRDGCLTWYDEQEAQAADCRFVKAA